jgi:hypothetical protein
MTSNGAVNILLDCEFTIQGTTGGDNGNATRTLAGTALTFKADKVSIKNTRSVADHSTAQDAAEFNRTTKLPQSISVETKLEKKANAPLLTKLLGVEGVVVDFTATSVGGSIEGTGIVEGPEFDYDSPSTLRFTIRQYGSLFTISAT